MKVRLGALRAFLREVALLEQASVPGRWDPRHGVPVDDEELEAMDETDERMVGDGAEDDIAPHLRSKEDGLALGDPFQENVNAEIREYLMQEALGPEMPDAEAALTGDKESDEASGDEAGSGGDAAGAETSAPAGFYTAFDMDRDHSATWYRSPGQPAGTGGDPFRSEDPHARLGFHPPGGQSEGEPLAPPIWQLSAGSDTSKVLGANAKPDSGGVDSGNGSKESEAPGGNSEEGEGDAGEDGDEGEGEEQERARPGDRQKR